jgi:hypothetical protein
MLNLWIYNYTFEFEISNRLYLINNHTAPWYYFNRCANYFLPVIAENDIILCYEKPVHIHLKHLENTIGQLPHYLELNHPFLNNQLNYQSSIKIIKEKYPKERINLKPWGWSRELIKLNNLLSNQLLSVTYNTIKILNSKLTSTYLREVLLKNSYQIASSIISTNVKTLQSELKTTINDFKSVYLKDFLGVSGNLMVPLSLQDDIEIFIKRKKKFFNNNITNLLVEKKIDIEKEFSLQFQFIDNQGHFVAITGLITSKKGQYLGNIVNWKNDIDIPSLICDIKPITDYILDMGYIGNLGFDFVKTKQGQVKMLEINARYTMGIVAHHWVSLLDTKNPGIFINTFFKNTSAPVIDEILMLIKKIEISQNCKIVLVHYVRHATSQSNHLITLAISASSPSKLQTALKTIFKTVSSKSVIYKMVKNNSLF